MASTYTFGDSDDAAHRLALVAQAYQLTSRQLLEAVIPSGVRTAVDLGCGPGHSTRLLATSCQPVQLAGLDSSPRYIDLARRLTPDPAVSFRVHDVTAMPMPGGPFDAIYARLVLAHLPDPLDVARRWLTQLSPGGVLVLEEMEEIDAPAGVLRDYEEVAAAMVASTGGPMYAGPLLAGLGGQHVEVDVDESIAAEIYGLNLKSWRADAERRGIVGERTLDRIAGGLKELHSRPSATSVTWLVRQISVRT